MRNLIAHKELNQSQVFVIILFLALITILCWRLLGLWNASPSLSHHTIHARVQITSIVKQTAEKVWHFDAEIQEVMSIADRVEKSNEPHDHATYIRVSWYGNFRSVEPPKLGETWELWLRLKPIWGRVNEVGFDYERWAFAKHLQGSAYVLSNFPYKRMGRDQIYWWFKLRQGLISRIDALAFDWKQPELIRALMVGDRSRLTQQDWQVYQDTGIAHLLAISGLHIGMAGLFAGIFWGWLWRRSSRCCHWIPAPTIMLIGVILGGGLYALFSGFQIPAQRAWWMLLVAGFFFLSKRFVPSLFILACVFTLMLIVDIRVIFQLGFWLSFSAVLFIILCFKTIFIKQAFVDGSQSIAESASGIKIYLLVSWQKIRIWLLRFFVIQVVLMIGLLPLLIYGFQQASWISIVVNFIVLPVVSLIIVPLLLCAIVVHLLLPFWDVPFYALLHISDVLLHGVHVLSSKLSELIGGAWYFGEITLWQTVLSMGCFVAFFFLKEKKKVIGVMLLAIVALFPVKHLFNQVEDRSLVVRILDVSQGLALILQTRNLSIIYDTGLPNIARQVIEPLFKKQYRQPNRLIISHYNADHSSGKDYLLLRYPHLTVQDNLNCVGKFHADGYDFELLQAKVKLPIKRSNNNHSCLVRVSYQGEGLLLLTGDIEASAERYLLDNRLLKLANKVLLVPHHGSKTSSTQEFLEGVKPQVSIISMGYANRFRHPSPSVVERLKANGSRVLGTACRGQINLEFQENRLYKITSLRRSEPRVWRNQC